MYSPCTGQVEGRKKCMKGIHPRSDIKKRSDSIANQCLILKPIGLGVFCDRKILIQLLS